ncbi:hypothetical protein COV19_03780 [Candidatus Woesearchaeota archaeon CG10_big_fil_rev_8_21_14_0_10_44_13]|nr:MAG: hypothetical protein COV19_03780 [Candidatus Woesearchaeota archaeon CG10_big_fil_rev_8_21_14_0_10_44_13]
MLIITPNKVIKEGQDLLVELREKQIDDHAKLIFNKDMKQKVSDHIKNIGTALSQIQGDIRGIVDSVPIVYSKRQGELYDLRQNEKKLIIHRDQILEVTGRV